MRIESSVVINQPVEKVFAFITDHNNATKWAPVKEMRPTSDGPIGVGSTFVQVIEIMGRTFEANTQVTQYDAPRVFAFKSISGPMPFENTLTLTPVDGGTKLVLVADGEPEGFFKLAGPLFAPMAKKQFEGNLASLKKALES